MASRNTTKNNEAIQSIMKSHPQSTGQISSYELDLAKKRSIEAFAEHVNAKFAHLDILINNAGLILSERAIS
jgi:NADP-dependent 3-hydroxy acid dehydrogenase YdfG